MRASILRLSAGDLGGEQGVRTGCGSGEDGGIVVGRAGLRPKESERETLATTPPALRVNESLC